MSEPLVCSQCNATLADQRVTIVEESADSSVVCSWSFCSWSCACKRAIRFAEAGRDAG